jgi:hypothetical protein
MEVGGCMSLRDEIIKLHGEWYSEGWTLQKFADSILQLPTDMEVVGKCTNPFCISGRTPCVGVGSFHNICSECKATGELVRPFTLGEAVEVPKMLLEGKEIVRYTTNDNGKMIIHFIELPDGSNVRRKK